MPRIRPLTLPKDNLSRELDSHGIHSAGGLFEEDTALCILALSDMAAQGMVSPDQTCCRTPHLLRAQIGQVCRRLAIRTQALSRRPFQSPVMFHFLSGLPGSSIPPTFSCGISASRNKLMQRLRLRSPTWAATELICRLITRITFVSKHPRARWRAGLAPPVLPTARRPLLRLTQAQGVTPCTA